MLTRLLTGLQGINGSGEARTWLLPLVRQHTCGASLAYWGSHLLPAARACGGLAAAAEKTGPAHQHKVTALHLGILHLICSSLTRQASSISHQNCAQNVRLPLPAGKQVVIHEADAAFSAPADMLLTSLVQALQCRALELQLWGTLPSFASWASDTATAFPCATFLPLTSCFQQTFCLLEECLFVCMQGHQ